MILLVPVEQEMRRWFLASVEPKMRRRFDGSCILSRKLGDGTLVPNEEMFPRKWGKVSPIPMPDMRRLLSCLKAVKMRKWITGFGWQVMRRRILGFCWAKNEKSICRFLLSRKLGDGTLVPVRPKMKDDSPVHVNWKGESFSLFPANWKWGNAHQFLWRKWGNIWYPVKQWKWGNGSLVSDDRLWGDDGRSSWQPVTEFSHFPESFVPPPSTTAGTVLSLYFFILLDIYEIGILSLKNMLY